MDIQRLRVDPAVIASTDVDGVAHKWALLPNGGPNTHGYTAVVVLHSEYAADGSLARLYSVAVVPMQPVNVDTLEVTARAEVNKWLAANGHPVGGPHQVIPVGPAS